MGWALPSWVGLSWVGEALPTRQVGEGRAGAGDTGGTLQSGLEPGGEAEPRGPWVTAAGMGPLGQLRAGWILTLDIRVLLELGNRGLMGSGLQGG